MRSRSSILECLKMSLREGLEFEENRREIKAYSTTFLCSRSSWRRDYLEHIKIIMDQASLSLGLTHNEILILLQRSRSPRPHKGRSNYGSIS
ncbi:unnamed protein product [Spirodela intermedia]|uniref:Uncharacterized protein n=1 Tax=Spirodela intermedia TaxID=51605 RepID=A0A7I8IU80_SPIIN|nr:unnamed protein product [Spirodela intermedia]CAA6661546.1 unnamed protein product [Spirodela intermedia]